MPMRIEPSPCRATCGLALRAACPQIGARRASSGRLLAEAHPWRRSETVFRTRGFTLLETMIALAVISLALGAAIRASSFGAGRAYDLQQRTLAGWVASNVTNELLATRTFPEMGAHDGKASQGKHDFVWREEVGATPNLSFRRVEIKVFGADQPDEVLAHQVSYVAKVAN